MTIIANGKVVLFGRRWNILNVHITFARNAIVVIGENMSSRNREKIKKCFDVLSQESRELYLTEQISEVEHSISPLAFYREYVSKNIPLIIRGGVQHWSAIGKWSLSYFRRTLKEKTVSVAVTPNGYADAIATKESTEEIDRTEYLVMPEERRMLMLAFLDTLENSSEKNVFYVQKQNSNFTEEFPELWSDADTDVPWATEAFGKYPDAANIWIGDKRAVTSMHKDPYENIYCVIAGEKEFILHPPTDLPWIPYGDYPPAHYREVEPGQWSIEPIVTEPTIDDETAEDRSDCRSCSNLVPWISIDPLNPDYERYPLYKKAKTLRAKIREGDILYLPSLWFHHVTQTHGCIALNYWYDMEYDVKYAYFKALEVLCADEKLPGQTDEKS